MSLEIKYKDESQIRHSSLKTTSKPGDRFKLKFIAKTE